MCKLKKKQLLTAAVNDCTNWKKPLKGPEKEKSERDSMASKL